MFNLTLINLSRDLRSAQPDFGTLELRAVDAGQLENLLERFSQVDPIQNHDAEPQMVIESRGSKYIVRTGQRKLFLYNARDSSVPYVELQPAQIVQELRAATAAAEAAITPTRTPTAPHHAIGVTILAVGMLLNGYTVYSVFYVDDVNLRPPIQLVTEARELAGLRLSVPGRYATGKEPGDRGIEIGADGSVRFTRVRASSDRIDSTDTYRIGRMVDGGVCLSTIDNGVIEVRNIDTLVYYRDTYSRAK